MTLVVQVFDALHGFRYSAQFTLCAEVAQVNSNSSESVKNILHYTSHFQSITQVKVLKQIIYISLKVQK